LSAETKRSSRDWESRPARDNLAAVIDRQIAELKESAFALARAKEDEIVLFEIDSR
jgi:hypothetical protein